MSQPHFDPKSIIPCLLCVSAPCSKGCPFDVQPGRRIRALRFANYVGAGKGLGEHCLSCSAPCQKHCVLPEPLPIQKVFSSFIEETRNLPLKDESADISVDLCGFRLENPFLLSSSVVASNYEMCARAFKMGWAGAAFKTISYLDMHEASPRFSASKNPDGSFQAFKNIEQLSDHSPAENFEIFRKLKKDFPTKYILASIMGRDEEEWRRLAIDAEASGADGIELNFSCPNMVEGHTGSDVGQIPELVELYTRAVKQAVHIPVIAKLTPNAMSMSPAAEAAKRAGADGIAAINTIKSLTNRNISQALRHGVADAKIAVGGLSGQAVRPIALRFIAELALNPELKGMHLSAMGGVYSWEDAMAFLSLGAHSIQVTTAVMEYGYRIIDDLVDGLAHYLKIMGYDSLESFCGSVLSQVVEIEEVERDKVILPRFLRTDCLHCGRCYLSCRDGGHQAIRFENRVPTLDPSKCVGCHLCILVCPHHAIESSETLRKKVEE